MMCKIWGFLFVFLLIEEEAERVTISYILFTTTTNLKGFIFLFLVEYRQQYGMMMCVPSRPFPTHLGHRPLPFIFLFFFIVFLTPDMAKFKLKTK